MARFEIEVNGVEYSGETASAKSQYQALHIAANSRLLVGMQEGVTDQALVLTLMSLPWEELQKLEALLIKEKVKRVQAGADEDGDIPVGINLFRDDPASYALLVGKVARENLSGFYALRGKPNAGAAQAAKP